METNFLAPGTVLQKRYVISRRLGRGGMGAVYQAVDRRLKVKCAVKEAFYTNRAGLAQFEREAHLLATLKHLHLPRVSDYFDEAGRYYLVMEYIPGLDLATWVKKHGTPSERQVVHWARQLLSALDYVHTRQPPIIHRDIKPANIKITPDNHAVLVDFGIAKTFHPQGFTTTGAKAISPGYSPPEQYTQGMPTNARSDIYSLGATLYFMLTQHNPPEAMQRVMQQQPLYPPSRSRPVSPQLESVVMRALNLKAAQRWPHARAMLTQLGGTITPPTRPRPQPSSPAAAPWQWLGLGVLVTIAVIAIIAIVWGLLGMSGRASPTPSPTTAAVPTELNATVTVIAPITTEESPGIAATSTMAPSTAESPGIAATSTSAPAHAPQPTAIPVAGCVSQLPQLASPADGASYAIGTDVTFQWQGGQLCAGETWQVTLNGTPICSAVTANSVTCNMGYGAGTHQWTVELRRDGQMVPGMRVTPLRTLILTGGSDPQPTSPPQPQPTSPPQPQPTSPPQPTTCPTQCDRCKVDPTCEDGLGTTCEMQDCNCRPVCP